MGSAFFCSFCEKGTDEVAKMIIGKIRTVAICNECVTTCTEILLKSIQKTHDEARANIDSEDRKGGTDGC